MKHKRSKYSDLGARKIKQTENMLGLPRQTPTKGKCWLAYFKSSLPQFVPKYPAALNSAHYQTEES